MSATIALLGQPNSGKSTVFNALTGLKQHVGNWPGKTVEKKEGSFTLDGKEYEVADLPGSYSLTANSDEEVITRDFIASGKADVVCILADSSQLQRSLYMMADYAGINVPSFLVLNMADVAADQGKKIDTKVLEDKLGIPVISLSATDNKKYDAFYKAMNRAIENKSLINVSGLEEELEKIDAYNEMRRLIPEGKVENYSPMWLGVKAIENDKQVVEKLKAVLSAADEKQMEDIQRSSNGALDTGNSKFAWIDALLEGALNEKKSQVSIGKLDRLFLSPVWGKPAVVITILLGLIGSFIPALPFMGLGAGIGALKAPVASALASAGASEIITTIVCNVIIQSFQYIFQMLGFVFGVLFVFGLLEEVGIMARISYVFDNTMAKIGLQGKSVMPFLISFGCTMGGAAGTRVIDNWGQKVLTIALAWAVPCGAAWAVVPTLSTLFFGPGAVVVIIAILATMVLHMWITAKIFGRKLVKKEDRYGMIMELPPYHKPKWGALLRYVFGRTKDTFFRVAKVVLLVCTIFWLLSYSFVPGADPILCKIGKAIEPVTKFFGMGWQLFMAFIASSVGKEGALGVISALFTDGSVYTAFSDAMSGAAASGDLNSILLANVTRPEALAFIFAITFNMPCVVALAATYQETCSAKWTAKIAAYYTVGALVIATIVYHIGLLIW
ncbi:MAG: ferrous iron transport protein B [Lachnospiraceae bacterium]|nr:ferrous iron transport protein B [Lachnospiraceae bacterium]